MPHHHPQLTADPATDICDAFVAHAERQPDAPALVWRDAPVSYGQLFALATRAWARLAALGLGAEEPVGIVAAKSPEAIALVLGCLLDRRPFLVPPATLPPRALEAAFARAGCRHALTPDATDVAAPSIAGWGDHQPPRAWPDGPDDTGFMFTTSGSTGVPKIVPLTTGGVNRFTDWVADAFEIRPGKSTLSYAPLNFVVTLLDLWTTLKCGGRVVLVDNDHGTNPAYLVDLLRRHRVHLVQAVPMFYRLLLDATREPLRIEGVEHVISTGDSITPRRLADAGRIFVGARLHNGYGSTETLTSFFNEVDGEVPGPTVPLGKPLPGVHVLVVDDAGGVLDGPGLGELYVATPFQTPGYLDPALNAAKFGTHPRGEPGVRYFRTGDLVRRDPGGDLSLVGRNDFEVKVRGIRVNAQEVERALVEHDDVVEAAVVALPDDVAGHLLHGMVRRRVHAGLNSLALRQHCALRLPRAAIPSTIRLVDEPLPKTASGKLDRRAVAHALGNDETPQDGTEDGRHEPRADHQAVRR